MDKIKLRDDLMHELWRLNKMDLMLTLREFIEGETATLWYLRTLNGEKVTPSQISDNLKVSRARAANILRALRGKGFVTMDIASEDRRKMEVMLTEKGKAFLDEKYSFLVRYFDIYVDVLGENDILELTRLLKKTVDNTVLLCEDGGITKEGEGTE